MKILFKGIRLLNPNQNLDKISNLLIIDGKIEKISENEIITDSETEIINAEKLVASPGLFDMHVHFREPGLEYKETIESGCKAAANGGFTGVVVMPNTEPVIDSPEVVEYIKQKAKGNIIDLYQSAAITQKREGKQLSPMYELADHGVLFFTDDGSCVTDSNVMRRAFEYASANDYMISQHAEDHKLTENFSANESELTGKLGLKGYPSVAEEIIVARDIMLAEYLGNRKYHVSHISTKGAIRIVRAAKGRGTRVSCEVTPHHFSLSDDLIASYHSDLKMNPPLRTNEDINAVIDGLVDGTIDCIATDHAPHALHEKNVEFEKAPCGIVGLETSLGVTLTYLYHNKKLGLGQIVEKMAINPRKILGLNVPEISENAVANLTIFNPDEEWIVSKEKFKTKSKNSPYNNYKLKGKPYYSINNNQIFKCDL
jgi:dihydroorotase